MLRPAKIIVRRQATERPTGFLSSTGSVCSLIRSPLAQIITTIMAWTGERSSLARLQPLEEALCRSRTPKQQQQQA